MNKTILMGRATKNPELKVAQNGKAYCILSLAVDDRGNEEKPTDFFDIKCFGKGAEIIAKFVDKGAQILVSCKAKQNVYEKQDGSKVYGIDFLLEDFDLIGNKKPEEEKQETPETPAEPTEQEKANNNELPF